MIKFKSLELIKTSNYKKHISEVPGMETSLMTIIFYTNKY